MPLNWKNATLEEIISPPADQVCVVCEVPLTAAEIEVGDGICSCHWKLPVAA